jgi:hypothetical protein
VTGNFTSYISQDWEKDGSKRVVEQPCSRILASCRSWVGTITSLRLGQCKNRLGESSKSLTFGVKLLSQNSTWILSFFPLPPQSGTQPTTKGDTRFA